MVNFLNAGHEHSFPRLSCTVGQQLLTRRLVGGPVADLELHREDPNLDAVWRLSGRGRSHQVVAGLARMQYVQISLSRRLAVVNARKQFRWNKRGCGSPATVASTNRVPGAREIVLRQRKQFADFVPAANTDDSYNIGIL